MSNEVVKRRAQIMGKIGGEPRQLLITILEALQHRIERRGDITHFGGLGWHVHPVAQPFHTDPVDLLDKYVRRLQLTARNGRPHQGRQYHTDGGTKHERRPESRSHLLPVLARLRHEHRRPRTVSPQHRIGGLEHER